MDDHRGDRKRKIPGALPVEGDELKKLLADNGIESLEEYDATLERGEELPGTHSGTVMVAWKEGDVGAEVERQLKELGVKVGEPLVLAVEWPEEPGSTPATLELKMVLRHSVDPEHPETIDFAAVFAAEKWRLLQERRRV